MANSPAKGVIGDILKFVIFILLIPLIIALTVAFCQEFRGLPLNYKLAFNWGALIYLIMHLLIYEPNVIYLFGQKLVSSIFRFFDPLVKFAPFFFPIYSILFLIGFYFENVFVQSVKFDLVLIFLISFTLMMHLVLTAKALKGKDPNAAKPNYFFTMSFIFVTNIFLISLLFDLIMPEFALTTFLKHTAVLAKGIYVAVYRQLF